MKKILLLAMLGVAGAHTVLQAENSVLPHLYLNDLSPDGRYVVSSVYGNLTILDRLTNKEYAYLASDDGEYYYEGANGNSISETGMILGSVTPNFDASYWQDGEWHTLYSNPAYSMMMPSGITPDGSRVVGGIDNLENTLGYEGTMLVPAYWDRKADGTYADPVVLPHPDVDFAGCAPQYITALCVTPDGKTIVGQVVDYSGYIAQPIVYRCDDRGEWSYELLASDLINPNHIELPAFMNSPEQPQPQEYMTPEMRALYDEDYQAYVESGYKDELMPDVLMYLDADGLAKYELAIARYYEEAEVYNEWLYEFYDLFEQVLAESTKFVFNSITISDDGSKFVTTSQIDGETFWDPKMYTPYVFDTATGEYTVEGGEQSVYATKVFNDGALLGYDLPSFGSVSFDSYYKPAGSKKYDNIYEYMLKNKPEVGEWMKNNMCHDVETFDEDYNPVILENQFVGGFVLATEDLSTLAFGVQAVWENEDDAYYYTYIIQDDLSGVEGVTVCHPVADISVKGNSGGVIGLIGEVASLEVYDINGRMVYSILSPSASVSTGLSSGVYIVSTTSPDGGKTVVRIAL